MAMVMIERGSIGVLLAAAIAGAACGNSGGPDQAAPSPRDAVVAAWTAANLTVSKLAPAPVAFAKDCRGGTVENLDVLLCGFASPADAKAAEEPGLSWVGAVTGASQAHGAVLVVLADRRKADPSGRTINRLMKLAPNERFR